jgi:hypothetical protein
LFTVFAGHPAALYSLPNTFQALNLPADPLLPSLTFRPRGRSMLDKEAGYSGPGAMLPFPGTTVWQRLAEYRVRDRVRVLTLWQTGGNSVSLQADHRGGPSLQWTSRLTGHSAASAGILDELFAKSLGAVVGRPSRSPASESGNRLEHVPEAAKLP